MAGCLDDATGTLSTHVRDQPGDIEGFKSCIVEITGMGLAPGGEESNDDEGSGGDEGSNGDQDSGGDENSHGDQEDGEDSSGREYHEYEEPQEADLVELQDGEIQLIDEREIDVGEYRFVQLDVDNVDATLQDGSEPSVEVPGEAPLKFNTAFEIREDTRTVFTAEFTPVQRGGTGEYGLQLVADGTEVSYGDVEE